MFIPCTEKQGTAYFEFQYCKKEWQIKKLVEKGYQHWETDSLLVHIDTDKDFFEHYYKYLEAPNGTHEFCCYGVNYYAKEQAKTILAEIEKDKPKDFAVLCDWLEKAVSEYNGFYFLGI